MKPERLAEIWAHIIRDGDDLHEELYKEVERLLAASGESYECGYRKGRSIGWDLGAIAAYEALPGRIHYDDNPFGSVSG